jgi:hypothetical protein
MLTESFIIQLDVDLHGTGLEMPEGECGRKVVVVSASSSVLGMG